MKMLTTILAGLLIASLCFCIFIQRKNNSLQKELNAKVENRTENAQKINFKVDSIQKCYDSLFLQKIVVEVKNHYKIIEKQKLVEIIKTDSNYVPIVFNPEYQLLAYMYDSIYSDKEFTENMLFIRNEQVRIFSFEIDSLKAEQNKFHKIFFRLFVKSK